MTAEWAPACLEDDELEDFRSGVIVGCRDCTEAFPRDMGAIGRCNGIPGELAAGIAADEEEEPVMATPDPVPETAADPAPAADEPRPKRRLSPEGYAKIKAANQARAARQRAGRSPASEPVPLEHVAITRDEPLVRAYRLARDLEAVAPLDQARVWEAARDLRQLIASAIADRAADAA